MRKSAVVICALVFGLVAACNYDTGECYYRGQGAGAPGTERDIILPDGSGGFGDTPPGPQDTSEQSAPDCNTAEQSGNANGGNPYLDDSEEAGLKVFCKKPEHGAPCSNLCIAQGIGCPPLSTHPYKSDVGWGRLFSCNDLMIGYMCGFHFSNGDDCYIPYGSPFPSLCSYSGND